jgi:hypothetical protein
MPLRLRDQAIGTNCPFLAPLDPDGLAGATRARDGTGPDPPEDRKTPRALGTLA